MQWSSLWRRPKANADLEEELRSHLNMAAADRVDRGESPAGAALRARAELGPGLLIRETTRDAWAFAAFDRFGQDLRYALRRLVSHKLFTAVAVLTLALGIGVNTAIFTLVHAVLYNTLPVSRPSELYRLGKGDNCCVMTGYQNGQDFALFSYAFYQSLRDNTPEIHNLAAFQASPNLVSVRRAGSSAAAPLKLEFVSSNYFDLFALHPALGAFFPPSAEARAAPPTLVLSYRAWRTHFAADPAIVGASLLINGAAFTVIGVAPPSFYGETLRGNPPDCWLPAVTEPLLAGANSLYNRPAKMWLYLMGRIPPPANRAAIESKINIETRRWYFAQAGQSPADKTRHDIESQFVPVLSAPGGVETMSIAYRHGLVLLMSLSSLVLLIACANVANLLLARVAALRAQNSLKIALGASRARMLRQALIDSVLLALLGCAAGLALAFAATRLIIALAFPNAQFVPIAAAPSLTVLAFAISVSLLTGLLFGAAPAWIETRSDPAAVLRGASRSVHSGGLFPQRVLVAAQAALSFVLLTGAGLLTQSLSKLEHQEFGFQTDHRLLVQMSSSMLAYTPQRLVATYRLLQQNLSQIPGVQGAALAFYLPMTGNNWNDRIYMDGAGPAPLPAAASYDFVSPGYFDVIGTRLLAGRAVNESDQMGSSRIAVVNQTFVEQYCRGRNPIGLRFGAGSPQNAADYQVVGVVADAKYNTAYRPAYPTFFLPLYQPDLNADGSLDSNDFIGGIVLRVAANSGGIEPLVRKTIAHVDSNLGVLQILPYADALAFNFNRERLLATLTQLFGILALVLASVGLYGLVTLSASRRTAEIGVRIALGANRRQVIGMILQGALAQVAFGIAIGLPASLFGARFIEHQLFGVGAWSPLALAVAASVLTACAVAAALIPATRAAVLDPTRALRVE